MVLVNRDLLRGCGMKAWVGVRSGTDLHYVLQDFPRPVAGWGELLVRVRGVGVNRADQYPSGAHFSHSPPAPAPIPGLEAAGEVVEVGEGVEGFRPGDRVAAMVQGGAAEFVCVKAPLALRVPPGMDWAVAACLPVSYLTAHNALVALGGLAARGSVLIHAVTSGVGLAALHLAVLRGAGIVVGSSTSPAKLERLALSGLTLAIADPYEGFEQRVLEHTGGRGVDVVVDLIGGSVLNETMRSTALGGRIVNVGRFGGVEAVVDLNLHAVRRIQLLGATFRTRSLDEHAAIVQAFLDDYEADLAGGRLAPMMDRVFGFDELPAAVQRCMERRQFGKVALRA